MGYFKGRLGSSADLRNLGSGGPNLGGEKLDATLEAIPTEKLTEWAKDAGKTLVAALGREWYCRKHGHTLFGKTLGCSEEEGATASDPTRSDPRNARQVMADAIDVLKDDYILNPHTSQIMKHKASVYPKAGPLDFEDDPCRYAQNRADCLRRESEQELITKRTSGGSGMGALVSVGLAIALLNQ